jgi:superfamily I DNA and/or RNA helicase
VQGRDQQEGNSPSFFNPEEAVEVVAHVKSVLAFARDLTAADIGIVTPYAKQCAKLRQLLARSPQLRDVAVGSVEQFQGGERRVIIVSTVRTSRELLPFDAKHALGFLDNPKRFNVAVTRARHLLIIVGDPAILALDNSWSALLRFAVARGAYRGATLPSGLETSAGAESNGLVERLRATVAASTWDDGQDVRGAEAANRPIEDAE